MGAFAQIGELLVSTLASLYLTVVMLRFLLQLARADFYNPISQFVVKATNPLLLPLRKVIPGLFGVDVACIVLGIILHTIVIEVLALIFGVGLLNPGFAILWAIIGTGFITVNIFFVALIVMIIASWVAPMSYNPILMLIRQLVEPLMAPVRKLIPPLGGLDISPIFAFLALQIVRILLSALGSSVNLIPQLVIGV